MSASYYPDDVSPNHPNFVGPATDPDPENDCAECDGDGCELCESCRCESCVGDY